MKAIIRDGLINKRAAQLIEVQPTDGSASAKRLAKASAYRVASEIETFAATEGRPYTVTVNGSAVTLDFSAELDAPATREDAAAIAFEIACDSASAAGLEPCPPEESDEPLKPLPGFSLDAWRAVAAALSESAEPDSERTRRADWLAEQAKARRETGES